MGTDLSARIPHPVGEQPEVEEWSAVADTFAGRVHIEWDTTAPVTPLGQLPFFIEYLKQGGLFDGWVADCPLLFTSPNAHLPGKAKRWGRCCAWSDAVICPAYDAAGRQPPACMGVRGPGPDHPKRARSTVESPGCPRPVSPTVAPYSPSAHPYVFAIVVSLRRHGRNSVGAAFDQQGPDDASHLVGQSNGD